MPDDLKDSDPRIGLAEERTRLANERTFLAWTRTGLAMVGGGILIIRVLTFQNPFHKFLAEMLGGSLIILGILIFVLSVLDFQKSHKAMKYKDFSITIPWSIYLISMFLGFISLFLLTLIFYELYFLL